MSNCFEKITPYYLLDLDKVISRYEDLKARINKSNREDRIAYSIKANYNEEIIKALDREGSCFEVCSKKELEYLLSMGIKKSKIIINGNTSFYEMVDYAEESLVILDSLQQLNEWIELGYQQNIGIRININSYLQDDRFVNKKSRFGIEASVLKEELTDKMCQKVKAIHCHLSGNNRDVSIYKDVIKWVHLEISGLKLDSLEFIDIGGGFKIGYDDRTFSEYVEAISTTCEELFPNLSVIYEPGNSLVNGCMNYWTKVISEKEINSRKIKVVDGSVLHLPNVKADMRKYQLICSDMECQEQAVYGMTCKESDNILKLYNEKELHVGDEVIVTNVGAYCINEVTDFILDKPKVYIYSDNKKGVFLGRHFFEYICNYSECKLDGKRNDFSVLNNNESMVGSGLYAFLDKKGIVLYIGAAHGRDLRDRVKQHFSNKDSGSIRVKLKTNEHLAEVEVCHIFACKLEQNKKELFYEEALLIGMYKPKFCFMGNPKDDVKN